MYKRIMRIVLAALLFVGFCQALKRPFYRSYECVDGKRCERTNRPLDKPLSSNSRQHASLQACRLVCAKGAGLWPLPTGSLSIGNKYVTIHPQNFQFLNINDLSDTARLFIVNAIDVFVSSVQSNCKKECKVVDRNVIVHVKIESSDLKLDWDTNESYDLEISLSESNDDVSVLLTSQTVFGARHGLETLYQLIAPTPTMEKGTIELVMLSEAFIRDKPVFVHRGLLIDTARNFLPIESILKTIDALAATKMNILHWHATDSQSFPLQIKSVPLMSRYGAYDPEKIYTITDMETVVGYAKSRGVRVILELDSPSHAGAGWEWGPSEGLGNLAVCINQQPWRDYCIQPPCGQLNPINPHTYSVLKKIYKDLLRIFGRSGMMHLGGDELFINCWNATEEITKGMSKIGLGRTLQDFLEIWSTVHNKQLQMLNDEANNEEARAIIWSSQLTQPEAIEQYLNRSDYIIQTWVEADKDLNARLLQLGYKIIVSTKDAWYLDHGFWGITRYHTWRDAYKNKIPQHPGVLGGEACMWGEYVTGDNLDARVWPRTAAVGERLWSDPLKGSTADAEPRMQAHIDRLQRRNIQPEAVAPEWCNQHEGQCL